MRSDVKPRLQKLYFWSELDIRVPDGVTSIGMDAFGDCGSLTNVIIPASVLFIGDGAFAFSGKVILSVAEGSYAEQYVKDNNIPYALTEE